ncbi:uncharacterized protein LOC114284804 [Camellia sinensis]|uniref:uncharacterized protein LOC114284804 n=1 Tax=Camellia sinensis TaxID=4442 RepID=UPI001035DB7A|nr:uncharacterized protein LOC114284804 [Camellia sinensis]
MVTDLFWAHPVSLEVLRAFSHVLIMDCTYKTNRYPLPLLEIVGVTSTNLTFSVTFAYLSHEREDNYTWALGVLRTVMDNTAFPKVIITDRELALMKETEFNEQFSTMKTEFSTYPQAIKYVTTNWLEPYKEKFVAASTDSNMHFENTTTNGLDKILVESKRSNSVGIDVAACGYILRQTDFFIKKFQTINETQQVIILKKLRELISPESTFLMEPELKTNTRGRSRGRGHGQFKIDTSTKREPSAFEFVLSGEDSYSQGVTISTAPVRKQVQRKKAKKDNSTNRISCFEQFLKKLRPYIRHIKDVQADGNCGFRAIARLIGLGEDDWQQVRRNLLIELHSNVVHYVQLFGTQERVDELNSILSYFEPSPGFNHWMTMPDMGHLIASYYRVVLYHLSMQQCFTFLPLRSVPIATPDRRDICIGFVNGNHFVQVYLQPGHPVPRIANNWIRFHHPCAIGWEKAYTIRIQQFCTLISPDAITTETIDIEEL